MTDTPYRYQHLVRQDCPIPPGSHAVAYCRDSGGLEQDSSVHQQIAAIQEYCAVHHIVMEHIYFDEARQASNTDKRDQLGEMIADLHHRFKRIGDRYKREKVTRERPFGVIGWKSSRLGRDATTATYIASDLRLRGLTIIDMVTAATTGNPGLDSVIESIQRYQDEMLLNDISTDAKRGLSELVNKRDNDPKFLAHNPDWKPTGNYLGLMPGSLPKGFKAERIQIDVRDRMSKRSGGEPHYAQRMVPNYDDDIWARCRLAWEMRRAGCGIKLIMETTRLYRSVASYDSFFSNRIYTGDLEYGGQLLENFVPALIPHEWFEEEQQRHAERSKRWNGQKVAKKFDPRRMGTRHLLAGLVVCGQIEGEEHPVNADTTTSKARNSRHDYYVCTVMKNSRGQRCQAARISAVKLERAVLDQLQNEVLSEVNLHKVAATIEMSLDNSGEELRTQLAVARLSLTEAQRGAQQLADAIEKAGYSETLLKRLMEREEQIRLLNGQVSNLTIQLSHVQTGPGFSVDQLESWIDNMRRSLASDDVQIVRQTVQLLITKIVMNRAEFTIHYRFPFNITFRLQPLRPEGSPLYPNTFTLRFTLKNLRRNRFADYDLDERRTQVKALRAEGMTYAEISARLGIPLSTVQHLATHQ